MSELLAINQLSAGYGPLRVLHEIDLTINRGERIGLVGLNGHGKTTLIRAITHMAGWQQGSIKFNGQEIGGNSRAFRYASILSVVHIQKLHGANAVNVLTIYSRYFRHLNHCSVVWLENYPVANVGWCL